MTASNKILPSVGYAKNFEDFSSYEGFDAFLIYCIHTSGFKKSELAKVMGIPESGLSLRMNQAGIKGPRFNTDQIQAYVDHTGDPRTFQYLKWRQEQASFPKDVTIRDIAIHINAEMKRLNAEVKKLNALLEAE